MCHQSASDAARQTPLLSPALTGLRLVCKGGDSRVIPFCPQSRAGPLRANQHRLANKSQSSRIVRIYWKMTTIRCSAGISHLPEFDFYGNIMGRATFWCVRGISPSGLGSEAEVATGFFSSGAPPVGRLDP